MPAQTELRKKKVRKSVNLARAVRISGDWPRVQALGKKKKGPELSSSRGRTPSRLLRVRVASLPRIHTLQVWFLIGLVLCITIVGIPLGLQCFKIAHLVLLPFGSEITSASGALLTRVRPVRPRTQGPHWGVW